MTEEQVPDPRAPAQQVMRRCVLASMALLAVTVACASWSTFVWPERLFIAVALLIPLALPLPGILRAERRTFAWATLCVTPYFIYGFTEIVANPALRSVALVMLLASLGLVGTLVAYLRITRPLAS
jgi:uncharacterized membrane protein